MISKHLEPFTGSSFSLHPSADQSFQGAKHQPSLSVDYYFPPWSTEDWAGTRFSCKHMDLGGNNHFLLLELQTGALEQEETGCDGGVVVGRWWDDGGRIMG